MADNKIIKFEIVTPERSVFKADICQATIPTTSGEITVLPGHIPLISVLRPGVIEIKKDSGEIEIIATAGGFVDVVTGKIVILADSAERAEELNEEKIKEAHHRAEELKKNAEFADDVEFANITAQIEKELARFKALDRYRHLKGFSK
jgi:F-type H+-transporting ATPase subunit epsilon